MLSLMSTTTARAVRAFHAARRDDVRTMGPAIAATASADDRDAEHHQQDVRRKPHAHGCRSRRLHETEARKLDARA